MTEQVDTVCSINEGATAWVLVAFLLVFTMMPGLAMFESGLLRSKNALSIFTQIFTGIACLTTLWYLFGFSLTFGPSNGGVIGSFHYVALSKLRVDDCISYAPAIPSLVFAMFQMTFATISPLLATGAFAERITFKAFLIFTIVWEILIYYPVAHWIFARGDGWLTDHFDVLDFAGGIVIHTSSGVSALVACYMIGPRHSINEFEGEVPPHNIPLAATGTALLWMGWFGFNAGSALAANSVAAAAVASTQIGACASALTWLVLSWKKGKPNTVDIMNGAIAGLAGITPISGYMHPQWAALVGVILGFSSYYSVGLIHNTFHIDDALDVSSVHGVTGAVGALLIGFFADKSVNPAGDDGVFYHGGWGLFGSQCLAVGMVSVWSAFVTFLIFYCLKKAGVPVRVSEEEELLGLDVSQHQETAYHELYIDMVDLHIHLPKHSKETTHKLRRRESLRNFAPATGALRSPVASDSKQDEQNSLMEPLVEPSLNGNEG